MRHLTGPARIVRDVALDDGDAVRGPVAAQQTLRTQLTASLHLHGLERSAVQGCHAGAGRRLTSGRWATGARWFGRRRAFPAGQVTTGGRFAIGGATCIRRGSAATTGRITTIRSDTAWIRSDTACSICRRCCVVTCGTVAARRTLPALLADTACDPGALLPLAGARCTRVGTAGVTIIGDVAALDQQLFEPFLLGRFG